VVSPGLIRQNMEVLGSDGDHVGIVDHVEGSTEVMLAKEDPDAGGVCHVIPLAWVQHVEMKVHLKHPGAEAKARWITH
jgi:hypothetical protein